MDGNVSGQRHYIGETCTVCECELVLVTGSTGSEVYVECDCGSVTCIGSGTGDAFSSAA